MNFEINMINVEDGDAIILMLKKENDKALILIDGGYKKYYSKLRKRLNEILPFYDNKIDLVVCTHYDNDHLGGIEKVLDDYHKIIEEVWIHKANGSLEEHVRLLTEEISSIEKTNNDLNRFYSLSDYKNFQSFLLIEGYKDLLRVTEKLIEYGLEDKTIEATSGKSLKNFNEFKVVSPTHDYYNTYLDELKEKKYLNEVKNNISESKMVLESYDEFVESQKTRRTMDDINPCQRLQTSSVDNNVSATNLVSIVTLLEVNSKKFLFTGDAGIETFTEQNLLDNELKDIEWLDIPHHGSKNNTSEEMLSHFNPKVVFVSGNGSTNRPHRLIQKCLESKRTGANFHVTNVPENTWYLKYDNGDIDRIFE